MTAENVEMVDVEVVEKKQVESSSPDVEKKEVEESSPEPEVVEKGDGEAAKDEAPAASTDEQAGEEEAAAGEADAAGEAAPEDAEEPETEKKEDEDEDFSADTEADVLSPGAVILNDQDRTFNAMVAESGSSLVSLQADGFQNLHAGARANYGITAGRYYYEIKMLDHPRMVRVGFSTVSADVCSLESENSFAFDSMGDVFAHGAREKALNPRWSRTDVIGVLLDTPKKTVTLFLNGTKTPTGQVTSIPDSCFDESGKLKIALYPTVVSKGSAVECNFTQKVWKTLPFKVRTMGGAKKTDIVATTKVRVGKLEKEDDAAKTCEVTVPVGFDCTELVEKYKKDHPDGWVLTQDFLSSWGEKSGIQKRSAGVQRGGSQEKFGLVCLDAPMSVFPMLLKGGYKYLMSLNNMHNLHPVQRGDVFAKLQHALNAKITGVVSVDSIIDVVDGDKQVPSSVRDYYEHVKLPTLEEGFDSISYVYSADSSKTQEELAELVAEKFTAWKKDCKLKSKVTDLKKSNYYQQQMSKYTKLKMLQNKTTAEAARKQHLAAAARAKEEKAKAKKAAEEKKEAEEKEEGIGAAEEKVEEEATPEEEDDAEPELPAIMEEFSEEDWMLAQLRAELHALLHAFRLDVNDEERVSFPAIHISYYYQLYSGKNFAQTLASFQCKNLEELTRLVPDICEHTKDLDDFALRKEKELLQEYDLVLPANSDADLDPAKFIEETEEARQMRTDRLDAGDENAALSFSYKPQGRVQGGMPKKPDQSHMKRPMNNQPQYSDFNNKRSRPNYR
eukprot:g393.t1